MASAKPPTEDVRSSLVQPSCPRSAWPRRDIPGRPVRCMVGKLTVNPVTISRNAGSESRLVTCGILLQSAASRGTTTPPTSTPWRCATTKWVSCACRSTAPSPARAPRPRSAAGGAPPAPRTACRAERRRSPPTSPLARTSTAVPCPRHGTEPPAPNRGSPSSPRDQGSSSTGPRPEPRTCRRRRRAGPSWLGAHRIGPPQDRRRSGRPAIDRAPVDTLASSPIDFQAWSRPPRSPRIQSGAPSSSHPDVTVPAAIRRKLHVGAARGLLDAGAALQRRGAGARDRRAHRGPQVRRRPPGNTHVPVGVRGPVPHPLRLDFPPIPAPLPDRLPNQRWPAPRPRRAPSCIGGPSAGEFGRRHRTRRLARGRNGRAVPSAATGSLLPRRGSGPRWGMAA